jgi:hypothetical protein
MGHALTSTCSGVKKISTDVNGPEQVIHPAMPGIAVLLGDELFIGRQHLPLITARLK